jgi:hypothetical protein
MRLSERQGQYDVDETAQFRLGHEPPMHNTLIRQGSAVTYHNIRAS